MECIFVAEDKSNIQAALCMEVCGHSKRYAFLSQQTNLKSRSQNGISKYIKLKLI